MSKLSKLLQYIRDNQKEIAEYAATGNKHAQRILEWHSNAQTYGYTQNNTQALADAINKYQKGKQ